MLQLNELPPELLLLTFSRLPYLSLISASAVCRHWRTLIHGDTSLRQRMFKAGGEQWEWSCSGIDEKIQFHPALSRISYRIGDDLDGVECLATHGRDNQKLIDLEISNDLASTPPMTAFKITIPPLSVVDKNFKALMSIHVTVTNPNGVRLRDIFSTMILEYDVGIPLFVYSPKAISILRIDRERGAISSRRSAEAHSPNGYIRVKRPVFS